MADIILNQQQLSTLDKNISQTFDQTESIELHKLAPLLSCSRGNSAVESWRAISLRSSKNGTGGSCVSLLWCPPFYTWSKWGSRINEIFIVKVFPDYIRKYCFGFPVSPCRKSAMKEFLLLVLSLISGVIVTPHTWPNTTAIKLLVLYVQSDYTNCLCWWKTK